MWTKTRLPRCGYGIVIDIYQRQSDPPIAKAFSFNDGQTWRIRGYFPPTGETFPDSRSAIHAAIGLYQQNQTDDLLKIF